MSSCAVRFGKTIGLCQTICRLAYGYARSSPGSGNAAVVTIVHRLIARVERDWMPTLRQMVDDARRIAGFCATEF